MTTHGERHYLDLVERIVENGDRRVARGSEILSIFGEKLVFDLNEGFPLLTTKRVFWRGVAEELLWFISGSTNANVLKERGIGIWDGHSSRAHLDSVGLFEREEGDLGPVYGFQWRHSGAEYGTFEDDYSGKGYDQLAEIVRLVRDDPTSRRILLSAWNPSQLRDMALPPCHAISQFYVSNGRLSCQLYQRSSDVALGLPFNIASYALLTHLIARCADLDVDKLHVVIGDAHLYADHVEPVKQQILREPRPFPIIRINPGKKDIDSFVFEDFEIIGYDPHPTIKMKMVV
jgi:dihydrofolate reductase/thymidylate synthase